MTDATRILLVEDHELLSEGVALALRASGYEVTVSSETSLDDVVALASRVQPRLVLLDLQLGDMGSGCDLVGPLRARGAEVLMLTGVTEPAELGACIEAGAVGVVAKAKSFDTLMGAIDSALQGSPGFQAIEREQWLAAARERRAERRAALEPFESLTAREAETLALLVDGLAAEAIAEKTFTSLATVRSHVRSILRKLGVNSQLAAVGLARRAGWPQSGRASSPGRPRP